MHYRVCYEVEGFEERSFKTGFLDVLQQIERISKGEFRDDINSGAPRTVSANTTLARTPGRLLMII